MTILQSCTRLDTLLSWCNFKKESPLPSWIPDWEKPFERSHMQWLRKWEAGGNLNPTWSVLTSGRSLQARGVMVDVVASVGYAPSQSLTYGTGLNSDHNSSSKPSSFGRYENEFGLTEAVHRTLIHAHRGAHEHGNLVDIYWVDWVSIESSDDYDIQLSDFWTFGMAPVCTSRNMRLDPWKEFDRFRQTNAHFSIFGHAFKDLFPNMRRYRVHAVQKYIHAVQKYIHAVQKYNVDRWHHFPHELTEHHFRNMRLANVGLRGRKLITTTTGYLGLAPEHTQEGDVINVLYGCNFPVVLRAHGNEYKYIGECYIDGIMNGEALEAQKKGEFQEVEITLC